VEQDSEASVDCKKAVELGSFDHNGCASAPANTMRVILGQSRRINCAYDFQVSTDAGITDRIHELPPPNQDAFGSSPRFHET
jgi:hypothetical protein